MTTLYADGYPYEESRPLWHDESGQPKRVAPPSQFPDLGGVSNFK